VGFQNLEAADPALPDRPGVEKKKNNPEVTRFQNFLNKPCPSSINHGPRGWEVVRI
jgi:hypothetical protein